MLPSTLYIPSLFGTRSIIIRNESSQLKRQKSNHDRAVPVLPLFTNHTYHKGSKNPSIKPSHLSTFILVLVPPLKTPNPSAS